MALAENLGSAQDRFNRIIMGTKYTLKYILKKSRDTFQNDEDVTRTPFQIAIFWIQGQTHLIYIRKKAGSSTICFPGVADSDRVSKKGKIFLVPIRK